MAVIRHSAAAAFAKDAVVLDLGDLAEQGRRLKLVAQAEAERIIGAARQERDRILAGAREEGRAKGAEEGRAAGQAQGRKEGHAAALAESRAKLAALEAGWTEGLGAFRACRAELELEAANEVVRLALEIAARVVKRAVAGDASIVADQVGAALKLAMNSGRLAIRVHPDDVAIVREAMPKMSDLVGDAAHVCIEPDTEATRGSCKVRSAGGAWIDAGVQTQLDRIAAAILPLGALPPEGGTA
ncbi:MAG: FliH/SctL family protein [Phycisphaerales bacterium]